MSVEAAKPEDIAAAIVFALSRTPNAYFVAVALDDRGRELAHAALLAGHIDGYVHVFDTTAGIAVAQHAASGALDEWLASKLQFLAQLGQEIQTGGAA